MILQFLNILQKISKQYILLNTFLITHLQQYPQLIHNLLLLLLADPIPAYLHFILTRVLYDTELTTIDVEVADYFM